MRTFDCEAINVGAAGIMLGLLSTGLALRRDDFDSAIEAGAQWLASRPAHGNGAGLFTGNAGVAVALAASGTRFGNAAFLDAARTRFQAACDDGREHDLFSGGAGVLWAASLLNAITNAAWPVECAHALAQRFMRMCTVRDGVPVWSADPHHDAVFYGCAHGSSGVAMALAAWARTVGDAAPADMARETFRALYLHARTGDGGAFRVGANERRHHAAGNWCHGIAGYLWARLQAFGDDPELRVETDWAVERLAAGMTAGTPTYCHGLAGQLELWRMLAAVPRFEALATARAARAARALRIVHHKMDGACAWVSDNPEIVTPDLWIGFLGPSTALALQAAGVRAALLSAAWLAQCAKPGDTP